MATTRGWSLKGRISDAINYILDLSHNEEKTRNGIYVCSSDDCTPLESSYRMTLSSLMSDSKKEKSKNIGYHFQFSLAPGEGDPDDCLRMAREWIEGISNGKAQYVIAVHTDKKSIHAHIVANSILRDGKYWNVYFKKDKNRFRAAADRICRKYGYSVLEETKARGRTYFEWMEDQNHNDSNRILLKKVLDEAVKKVSSYEDLKSYMEAIGFKIYDNQNNKEVDKNIFRFTADIKLITERADGYMIRVPYQKDYIHVEPEYFKWLKEGKTAEIKIPIDKKIGHFDMEQNYTGMVSVEKLKQAFEDKTKKGRDGLRIKIPGSQRAIRTKYLDEEGNYTLEMLTKRIKQNGRYETDPEVQNLIDHPDDYTQVEQQRRDLFQQAEIHMDFLKSTVYRSIRQENYFKWKSEQMVKKMDKFNYENLLEKDRKNLNVLESRKEQLSKELKTIYQDIKRFDEQVNQIMLDQIENVVNAEDMDLETFIKENRVPLEQRKSELKKMISLYNDRISNAKQQEQKKQKQQQREIFITR